MEEPINNNIESIPFQQNYINQNNLLNNDDLIKLRDEKIKELQRKIKGYEQMSHQQNIKSTIHDNLYIEYNSLNKNYNELEAELNGKKIEISQLLDALNNKNNIISEYQKIIEESSEKFKLFNESNMCLKNKIEANESKVKMFPTLLKNNEELNKKITSYKNQIENLKNEIKQREDLYKNKLSNLDKNHKITIREYENEITDLKVEIGKLKLDLDNLKKKYDDLNQINSNQDIEFAKKYNDKERENDKLAQTLLELQNNFNFSQLNAQNDISSYKRMIDKLNDDLNLSNKELNDRDEQISQLNDTINEFNKIIQQSENELKNKNDIINNLNDEKNKLEKKLLDKENDLNLQKKISNNEINALKKQINFLDKARNNLVNDKTYTMDQIYNLQNQLNQFKQNNLTNQNESFKLDKKYNDLVKTLDLNNKSYQDEINRLSNINLQLSNQNEILKAEYEKKIQMLTLSNNELNARVKNLLSSLIALKDYALSIERNMNDANMNINNSLYSFPGGRNHVLNINSNPSNDEYSREMIKNMKDMINKIDSKILNNNDYNQMGFN